jgi:hypothetical protein
VSVVCSSTSYIYVSRLSFWTLDLSYALSSKDILCDFYLLRSSVQGHKEWINEVNFLGVVKHPNLVKLVGYCAEDDERGMQRLLVYELMRNKSLEDHLLARVPSPLPWITRLKIGQDAARGLAYLHEEMDFQVHYSCILQNIAVMIYKRQQTRVLGLFLYLFHLCP